MIDGRRIDTEQTVPRSIAEKGSVIVIIATDIPLNERQLKRVAKRATVALSRTGSFIGNGSGDIAIAFSNTNIIPHYSEKNIIEIKMFYDDAIDKVFEATAEVVEEAVISSIYHAETVKGIRGKKVFSLKEFL
jgi:D-aminopeptidase